MAVKTITIDVEAYALLSAQKQGKESFSQVIKRRLQPPRTARSLLAVLPVCQPAEETLEHLEDVVRRRTASPAVSEPIDAGS